MFSWLKSLILLKSKEQSSVLPNSHQNITTLDQLPAETSQQETPSESTRPRENLIQLSRNVLKSSSVKQNQSLCSLDTHRKTSVDKKMAKRQCKYQPSIPSLAKSSRYVPKIQIAATDYSTFTSSTDKIHDEAENKPSNRLYYPPEKTNLHLLEIEPAFQSTRGALVKYTDRHSTTLNSIPKTNLVVNSLVNMSAFDKENRLPANTFKKSNQSTAFSVNWENNSSVFVSQRKLSECFTEKVLFMGQFRLGCHMMPIMQSMNQASQYNPSLFPSSRNKNVRIPIEQRMASYNLIAKSVVGLKLKERSWFLAIDLLERSGVLLDAHNRRREIICIACVMIASKMEHVRYPRPILFLKSSGTQASVSELTNTESSLLSLLGFRLVTVLIYDFYVIFSAIAKHSESAKSLGMFILKAYLSTGPSASTNKQLVAFSLCLFLARRFKSPRFWTVVTKDGITYYSMRLGSDDDHKSQTSVNEEIAMEYFFEASETDTLCEQITKACIRCQVDNYWYIFQIFTTSSEWIRLN